jgi:hypothetical protein
MAGRSSRVFLLRLRSLRPADETNKNLRWLLKKTLRQLGFQCVDVREVTKDGEGKAKSG